MITSNKRILGLAGTFGSGKDMLADYLVDNYQFLHISTSDMVRQHAMRLHGSIERPVLHTTANELRAEKGPGVLATMSLEHFHTVAEKYAGVVISGIRSIGEVEVIAAAGGTMIFVDAPVEIRYQRMISRQRDSESQLSLEAFKAGEAAELSAADKSDKTVQNLDAIRQLATVQLSNASDPATFVQQAVSALDL